MFNYINFLLGEEAVASPSIGNNLWCIWTVFTHPAITPPEVNGFGWNLGQSEYIVWSWPWQIMGAIRAEERAGARAEILFFFVCEQGAISPTSGWPNFTKFAHKTWIYVAMNPFRKRFWKFARKGSFFQKSQKVREHSQQVPTSGPDICEMNTNRRKSRQVGTPTECWLSICTVGINSKSFFWPAGRAHETTFLDIAGSSVSGAPHVSRKVIHVVAPTS